MKTAPGEISMTVAISTLKTGRIATSTAVTTAHFSNVFNLNKFLALRDNFF